MGTLILTTVTIFFGFFLLRPKWKKIRNKYNMFINFVLVVFGAFLGILGANIVDDINQKKEDKVNLQRAIEISLQELTLDHGMIKAFNTVVNDSTLETIDSLETKKLINSHYFEFPKAFYQLIYQNELSAIISSSNRDNLYITAFNLRYSITYLQDEDVLNSYSNSKLFRLLENYQNHLGESIRILESEITKLEN